MNVNFHLLIIIGITVTLFIIYQLFDSKEPASAVKTEDGRYIEIIQASWGANCSGMVTDDPSAAGGFATEDPMTLSGQAVGNNVLQRISSLCNGKKVCTVHATPEMLGRDPAPACADKKLEVEYRCFSYDRPWSISADNRKTLKINCNQ